MKHKLNELDQMLRRTILSRQRYTISLLVRKMRKHNRLKYISNVCNYFSLIPNESDNLLVLTIYIICITSRVDKLVQNTFPVFLAALLWQELKQLYQEGAMGHFSSVYNHMDFFMLNFYIASFTLRFVTYLKVG